MSEANVKEEKKPAEKVSAGDSALDVLKSAGSDDISRVSAETSARVVKLYKLFEKYAGDMSPRDQRSYALWLRDYYERAVQSGEPLDDERIFAQVREEFMADMNSGKSEETPKQEESPEQPKEGKASPRGKVETAGTGTEPIVTTEEAEYYLADDEKYFQWRADRYDKMRTYKPIRDTGLTFKT